MNHQKLQTLLDIDIVLPIITVTDTMARLTVTVR